MVKKKLIVKYKYLYIRLFYFCDAYLKKEDSLKSQDLSS